jgi:hypothetical protein
VIITQLPAGKVTIRMLRNYDGIPGETILWEVLAGTASTGNAADQRLEMTLAREADFLCCREAIVTWNRRSCGVPGR